MEPAIKVVHSDKIFPEPSPFLLHSEELATNLYLDIKKSFAAALAGFRRR